MSDLPNWIENRIDRNLDNTLTQEHVVETMVAAERPFFSTRQLQARVKPDVSKATVRNRLDELQEIDIVATETYPESVTLYYINYRESNWPLSPEGKTAIAETPQHRLSIGPLAITDTAGVGTLVVFSLLLLVLSAGLTIIGIGLWTDVTDLIEPVGLVLGLLGLAGVFTFLQLLGFSVVVFISERLIG